MNIGVVILAAGESARMGVPKQLLDFRGKALLQHAIDIARSLSGARVAIVLGAHAAEIRAGLSEADAHIVENTDWRSGMGGSLRAGLGALIAAHPELSAAILMLCDQPLLTQQTLADLVAAHAASGRAIVASEYDGYPRCPSAVRARDVHGTARPVTAAVEPASSSVRIATARSGSRSKTARSTSTPLPTTKRCAA